LERRQQNLNDVESQERTMRENVGLRQPKQLLRQGHFFF
jgi:hypothetical protein